MLTINTEQVELKYGEAANGHHNKLFSVQDKSKSRGGLLETFVLAMIRDLCVYGRSIFNIGEELQKRLA